MNFPRAASSRVREPLIGVPERSQAPAGLGEVLTAPRAFAARTREPGWRGERGPSQPPPPTSGQPRPLCAGTGPPAACRPVLLGGGKEFKTQANANGHRWGPTASTFPPRGASPGAKPGEGSSPLLSPSTFPTGWCSNARPRAPKKRVGPAWAGPPEVPARPGAELGTKCSACSFPGSSAPHASVGVRPAQAHPFGGSRPTPFVVGTEAPLLLSRWSPFLLFLPGRRRMGGLGHLAPVRGTPAGRPCPRLSISATREGLAGRLEPPPPSVGLGVGELGATFSSPRSQAHFLGPRIPARPVPPSASALTPARRPGCRGRASALAPRGREVGGPGPQGSSGLRREAPVGGEKLDLRGSAGHDCFG